MARSLLKHSVLIAFGLGFAGAIGCSGTSTTGTGTTGSAGAGGAGGAEATSSTATSSSSVTASVSASTTASVSASASSSASTSGAGGAGGAGTTSSTGGMGGGGAGGMGTSTGTGVNPKDIDIDSDGWTENEGDCCEEMGGNCENPKLVNPGAFEYLGNGVDDDCDATTLDGVAPPDCSPPALTLPTGSDDLIRAMDLCQTTTESPTKKLRKWGVIETSLLLADGSALVKPKELQAGVLADYGTNVTPRKGGTMASISSGTARDAKDFGYVHPQNGTLAGQSGNYNAGTKVGVPAPWLAAHGGIVPSPGNCPSCTGTECANAFDSVKLRARIRVPTNARSFSYNFKFYTAEYPEFVCQQYNDFFLTLLQSTWKPNTAVVTCTALTQAADCESGTCNASNTCAIAAPLPVDKNIAFDGQHNAVSVNNGFFEVCYPTANAPAGACPSGTQDLVGTGMGGWTNPSTMVENLKDGGGTEWLINEAPVVPGETMEIEFVTWDAGDHNVDSLVLLDKFRFSVTPSSAGVHK
jgi:hypothetical protein